MKPVYRYSIHNESGRIPFHYASLDEAESSISHMWKWWHICAQRVDVHDVRHVVSASY